MPAREDILQTCDHTIGTGHIDNGHGAELIQMSTKEAQVKIYCEHQDWFNYCPTCGARLETV